MKPYHVQCIRIDLLHFIKEEVSVEGVGLHMLEMIQSYCADLKMLTTAPESSNTMENWLNSFDGPSICARALALIAARFETFRSLQEIVLEFNEEGPSSDTRKKVEIHGWILKVVERAEVDWKTSRSLDGFEDDEYLYNDNDVDDYDIDNDSDFWRRAAD
jgi:hypothetical protein